MKTDQDTIIQTLQEQNKHLLDRLEKAYEDKSELRRKIYNNGNGKAKYVYADDGTPARLNMKRGDPTKEGTD